MESNILTSVVSAIHRWGLRSGLGVVDQVIFSGANFLTSIILARLLSERDFGQLAIGFAILSILMQVYTSFALEPMSILGPAGYRDRIASYLLGQVQLLFLLSVPVGILLSLVIWLYGLINNHFVATRVLILSAISLPFILFPLLMRRIFYVLGKPGLALLGSVVYFMGLIFIFILAMQYGTLNGESSLLIVSLAALLSGLTMLLFLYNESSGFYGIDLTEILVETWSFGKWLIVSGVLIGLATQSQIYLTGVLSHIEGAGAVRILQTFIQPMMLIFTALSALATPAIVNDFALNNYQSMGRKIFLFTLLSGVTALGYEFLLIVFGSSLNFALFNGKYSAYSNQIPIWGLVPVIWSLFWGGAIALQAIQKPHAMVIISGLWVFFSLVPGLFLIPALGVWGATISIVAGFIAAFMGTWVLYWIMLHRKYIAIKE